MIGRFAAQVYDQLKGAPNRYWYFVRAASSTSFFQECENKKNNCLNKWSVSLVIFPIALSIYAISIAVSNVLRYSLLQIVVSSSLELPLLIGVTDAILAGLDVLVRIHGKWDTWKVHVIGTPMAPIVASILYGSGITIQLLGVTTGWFTSYSICVVSYTIGAFLMSRGKGFLWNVWSQVIKPTANQQLLVSEKEDQFQEVDFQGKMAQFQVVLRYLASSSAPLIAAFCLRSTNVTISYLLTALSFICLAIWIAYILSLLINSNEMVSSKTKMNKKDTSVSLKKHTILWSEMLPAWFLFNSTTTPNAPQSMAGETTTLIPMDQEESMYNNNRKVGRFSDDFFHCGMFTCLTESVRNGYTRIICLRAATAELSDAQLAQILSVVGGTAVLTFWLSDIADTNRRLAAFLSFIILAIGHLGLASSSSSCMVGFYLSGILFGLGEGLSTGLRALIKQDYLSENGPLTTKIELHENGKLIRRLVSQKIGVWADVTLVVNSVIVGILGHFLGMRVASFLYGLLGLYGAYFSIRIMPDSKPHN